MLVETYRRKILSIIDGCQPQSRYKCLVVDSHVKTLIDTVLERDEILKQNVTSIEIVDQRRPPLREIDALYIVRPTKYNLACIAADYTISPYRYAGAHLVILPEGGLSERQVQVEIQNSAIRKALRSGPIVEYIDFIPFESHVFSLPGCSQFEAFYHRECFETMAMPAMAKVASQIASVAISLGEYPIIRHLVDTGKGLYNAERLPSMIAKRVQAELDNYARVHDNYPVLSENRPASSLVILDRSVDPYAPIMHEFSFQAMVYDLLKIQNKNHYLYERTENDGAGHVSKVKEDAVLDDNDQVWISLRHEHISTAIDQLQAKINKLEKDNPNLADTSKKVGVRGLQDMVFALPQFQESKKRYGTHLQLAAECMEIFTSHDLFALATLEQNAATGTDENGKRVKNLADNLVELLVREGMTVTEKTRLLMAYALHRGGLIEADLQKLKTHASLTEQDIHTIKALAIFGHDLLKPALKIPPKSKKQTPVTFFGARANSKFDNDRFVPGVKTIVEQLINESLSIEDFPSVNSRDGQEQVEIGQSLQGSLRNPNQRAVWAQTGAKRIAKQRIFVYVVGGVTASEMRSIYELNAQYQKEIFIGGGDGILTPSKFLNMLSSMSAHKDKLNIPELIREPTKAPDVLFERDRPGYGANGHGGNNGQSSAGGLYGSHNGNGTNGYSNNGYQQGHSQATQPQGGKMAIPEVGQQTKKDKEKKKGGKFGKFFK